MRCTRARRWIVCALAGSLSERRRCLLDEHLGSCDACRAEEREAVALWQELGRAEALDPGPAYWESFATRLRRRLRSSARAEATLPRAGVSGQDVWCRALAAAAVVLVAVLVVIDRPQPPTAPDAVTALAEALQSPDLAERVLPTALEVEDPFNDLNEAFNSLSSEQAQSLWNWLEQEMDTSRLLQRRSSDEVS